MSFAWHYVPGMEPGVYVVCSRCHYLKQTGTITMTGIGETYCEECA